MAMPPSPPGESPDQEEASLLEMAVVPLFAPARAGRQVGLPGAYAFAWLLVATMAVVTGLNTLNLLYHHAPPALLPPPFGVELEGWRFLQRLWFPPYAVAATAFIVWGLTIASARLAGSLGFRAALQAVAIAFFFPWLATAPLDAFLIASDLGRPAIILPYHIAAFAWGGWNLTQVLKASQGSAPADAAKLAVLTAVLLAAFLMAPLR